MDTVTNAQVDQNGTAPKNRGRLGLRRTLAVLAASLLLPLSASVAMAEPAGAAGGLSYCFFHTNGAPYQHETHLQLWYNNQWNAVWNDGRGNRQACRSITISGWWRNHPARMVAATQVGGKVFVGATPSWAPAGSASYNLGTGYVNS